MSKKHNLIFYICGITLSIWSVLISLSLHASFNFHAFDFGIFDQLLYFLSKGSFSPYVTIRQIENLFLDHQHFGLILIAPIYWFNNGNSGYTLALITPLLLHTLPLTINYKTIIYILKQKAIKHVDDYKGLIFSLISMAIFFHQHFLSSLVFGFHEKYLVPIVYSIVLYCFAKCLYTKEMRYFIIFIIANTYWITLKEDQYVFAAANLITLTLVYFIYNKGEHRIKTSTFKLIILLIGLITTYIYYGTVFLSEYRKNSFLQYDNFYKPLKNSILSLFTDWNLNTFIANNSLLDVHSIKLYKYLVSFDIFGLLFNPILTLGDYAERILSNTDSIKSPLFHYGISTPYFTIGGLIILLLLIKNNRIIAYIRIIGILTSIIIVGFSYNLVTRQSNYIAKHIFLFPQNLLNTNSLRQDLFSLKIIIPEESSLVVSDPFVTHFTARKTVANFPDTLHYNHDIPTKTKYEDYEYWLLYKTKDFEKILELSNDPLYIILKENTNFVLIKKIKL
jgi:uncharacterized membrane protein